MSTVFERQPITLISGEFREEKILFGTEWNREGERAGELGGARGRKWDSGDYSWWLSLPSSLEKYGRIGEEGTQNLCTHISTLPVDVSTLFSRVSSHHPIDGIDSHTFQAPMSLGLKRLIQECMQDRPENRPLSASQVFSNCRSWLEDIEPMAADFSEEVSVETTGGDGDFSQLKVQRGELSCFFDWDPSDAQEGWTRSWGGELVRIDDAEATDGY
jgi:hypothetical protein